MNVFDLFAKISLDTSEYEKGLSDSGGILDSFSSKFTNVLKDLSAKFFEFGKDCVSTGMDFDKAMSQVAATMGTTTEQIGDLRDFAREMGANTAFSATEAAEALNYMALAGYKSAEAMEMLPSVLNLAAAGNIGLAQASKIVTNSQNALGLTMEETTVMIDQMAAASSNSGTDVAQLGEAILTIGSNAKHLKGGTAEMITLLGELADSGKQGSEGGTKLRNVLNALHGSTKDARAMMEQYNISLYDSKGKIRDVNAVLLDMKKVIKSFGDNDAKRDNFIETIFNMRDTAAALDVIDAASERYGELLEMVTDSGGAASKMADEQLNNLAGDATILQSALSELKITVSDLVSPYLRSGVQSLTTELTNFTGAFKANGIKGVSTMFRLEWESIQQEFVQPLLDFLSGDSGDVYTGAIHFAGNLLTNLTDPKAWSAARDKFSGIVQNLIDGLTSQEAIDAFLDTDHGAPKVISNLIENMSGMAVSFIDLAGSLLDNIFKYIADPGNQGIIRQGAEDIMISLGTGFVNVVSSIHSNIVELMSDIAAEMVGEFDADATALEMILKLGKAMGQKIWESTLPGRIGKWIGEWEDEKWQEAYVNSDAAADYQYSEVENDPELRKILAAREQYMIDKAEMSDAEIGQWLHSGSPTDPLSWYSGLSTAEKMALYAERNDVKGIPRFAEGGIVTRPTLALIGEKGPEEVRPLGANGSGGITIQFGDIYVNGTENAGQDVVRNIDEALRIYQLQQKRGIGGVAWQS